MGGNGDKHQKRRKHTARSNQRGSTSTRSSSANPPAAHDPTHASESNYGTGNVNEHNETYVPYINERDKTYVPYINEPDEIYVPHINERDKTYVPYINEPDEDYVPYVQGGVEFQEYAEQMYNHEDLSGSHTTSRSIPPVAHRLVSPQYHSTPSAEQYSLTTTNTDQVATGYMTVLKKGQQDSAYTEELYQEEESGRSHTSSRGIPPVVTQHSAPQQYYSASGVNHYPSPTTTNNDDQVATSYYMMTALNKAQQDSASLMRVNYDNAAILYCQQERPQLRQWTNEKNNSNLHTGEVLERRYNWEHERLERL